VSIRQDRPANSQEEKELIRLASFSELNPNPVVEIDTMGNITYINPAARNLFPDMKNHHAEHPFFVALKPVINILTSEEKKSVHTREIAVGDKYFIQTFAYFPVIERIRIYCVDDTARRKTEQALRESERRLADATFVIDRENRVIAWNLDMDTLLMWPC